MKKQDVILFACMVFMFSAILAEEAFVPVDARFIAVHTELPPENYPIVGFWYDRDGVPRSHVIEMVDGRAWEYSPYGSSRLFEFSDPKFWTEVP